MKIEVSVLMIPYNNEDKALTRLSRDILPTFAYYPECDFELVVVDNSEKHSDKLAEFISQRDDWVYQWNSGKNLKYSTAANLAVSISKHPYLLYVCSCHGRMHDPTWLEDMFKPILESESVAKTGTLCWSPFPNQYKVKNYRQPRHHVQGGVFAARSSVMKAIPYDTYWEHYGADIQNDYRIMEAGYVLRDVSTIKSVWRKSLPKDHGYKFTHDTSED